MQGQLITEQRASTAQKGRAQITVTALQLQLVTANGRTISAQAEVTQLQAQLSTADGRADHAESMVTDLQAQLASANGKMDRELKRNAKSEQRYLKAAATLAEQLATAEEALKQAVSKHQVCNSSCLCFH